MTKGIFKILFDLKARNHNEPLEDYLTELFAYTLAQNQDVLKEFLKHFKIGALKANEFGSVSTQVELPKLESHNISSRPDIVISMEDSLVFFENKINATEGYNQLRRYADHLEKKPFKNKTLVYLTRDYDKKHTSTILKNCNSQINFVQLRWYQIFSFLTQYKNSTIISELLKFMKQINLSMNNQFTPSDIITLTNFSKVKNMMDETMFGEISKRFEEINRAAPKSSTALTQLGRNDNYTYWLYHNDHMSVSLGYWMNSNNEKEYPEIGIAIEIESRTKKREQITQVFKQIVNSYTNWEPDNLELHTGSSSIYSTKSLQAFLSCEDHITEIKKYLHQKLDELESILDEYTQLPRR
ncbi:PD-(D/E)XK nuclease family protein [Tenacibaculum sp. Mcav3-52]|uniref:PD-(D/E)XK nuclease family protein n=1 Tax=Tenacibaculum sp. Mcav3-52 TaxID=2917762 RepID=UPI001EF2BE7F|nr:PD-(D/E)XK nuclease family protein [Tenacibaculum sp. Mcav3-52]MCG7501143.1 PD-(D/E)XK nuclease family protein [Tenacibaculum sp. Mcav3-52]